MHRTRNILHKTPNLLFNFTSAGEWNARRGAHFPAHMHTYWEIVCYQSGNIDATIGDEHYKVRPGMVLITPPQTLHSETARTAYSNFYIGIDAPAGFPWPRVCLDGGDREFQRICQAIVNEWTASKPQKAAMLASLLNQLVILIQRNAGQLPAGEALVRRAEQIINQGFATRPAIRDIAREAGASVSSLRAHFSRLRKCSPLDHLHAVRVGHALSLLRTSTLTLDAIAEMCGYHSASHLSRYVKKATARSPGALRSNPHI
ncbi:MAG: AraC family transcriptional regulator [Chthoniobacteraceae bacterium]